ncbi:MAG TPA: PE-PPE domain-containing protein [Mycobacterium sp.]|nr:PE-PPE domain-containing protein [Mycobacterium sp.]
MRTTIRKAGVACGTAVTSLAIALSTPTGAGASNSAVIIGGIGAGSMGDLLMAPLLGGALRGQERVNVNWPAQAGPMTGKDDLTLGASIAIGITNLTASIDTALGKLSRDANGNVLNGEKVTVVGLSAGSLVVNEVLRNMIASGELTDPDEISFVVVEDSSRQELIKDSSYNKKFDYTYHLPPVVPYDVVVVTGEYDGMADLPDRWWNFLAVANAMAGAIFVHVPVMYSDLSKVPDENITVDENIKGGTTTHYLVPTKTLPLVQLMPLLKSREAQLKAKIDKGYARNDPVTTTADATAKEAAEPAAQEAESTEPAADPAARRSARAEARVEAATARREARAEAKAEAAARREARAASRADSDDSSD